MNKKERKNCALDPLPVLKIPISKGTKTSLHYSLKETKTFLHSKMKGTQNFPSKQKLFQPPTHKVKKIKNIQRQQLGSKTGTEASTHTYKNVFSAFHFSPFYWEGSSEGFVVVCALTCESVPLPVKVYFLIRPLGVIGKP